MAIWKNGLRGELAMGDRVSVQANKFVSAAQFFDADFFGIVQTGFGQFNQYKKQFDYLNGGHVRWPGGYLSEVQTDVYGLDIPGLFDGTQLWNPKPNRVRPDLSDMLNFATAKDIGLAIQIPTARYASNLSLGQSDLKQFLNDLNSGVYGPLPKHIDFEIGNEFYTLPEFRDNPEKYGVVANAMLETIQDFLEEDASAELTEKLRIGIQMGRTEQEDYAIRNQIDASASNVIDFLIAHHMPYRYEAVDVERYDLTTEDGVIQVSRPELIKSQKEAWDDWFRSFNPTAPLPEYQMTGWTIGEPSNNKIVDLTYQDYGARQASAALELFVTHTSIGMSAANLWGVDVTNPNSFSNFGNGSATYLPGGEIFRLMSESLQGQRLLEGFEGYDRSDPFSIYSFRNYNELTVFVAANDIPDNGYNFTLELEGFGQGMTVKVDRLGYTYDPDMPVSLDDPSARLYEKVDLSSWQTTISGNTIELTLAQDFEVLRLQFSLQDTNNVLEDFFLFRHADPINGSTENDKLSTYTGTNSIDGSAGDDVISGGIGRDYIKGGQGDDVLVGDIGSIYFGNDVLQPGKGDDLIFGGGGADIFVFKPEDGNDIIGTALINYENPRASTVIGRDFDVETDTLMFVGFGYSNRQEVLENFRENENGYLEFRDQGTSVELYDVPFLEIDDLNIDYM